MSDLHQKLFSEFWAKQSAKGDPSRNPNLVKDAMKFVLDSIQVQSDADAGSCGADGQYEAALPLRVDSHLPTRSSIDDVKHWAEVYSSSDGAAHYVGHLHAARLLKEYLQLREDLQCKPTIDPIWWVHDHGEENGGHEFYEHPTGSDCKGCHPLFGGSDVAALFLALADAQRSAAKWKEIAEFKYALRRYPDQLSLGQGALDAWAAKWPGFDAAIAREVAKRAEQANE